MRYRPTAFERAVMEEHHAGTNEGQGKPGIPSPLAGWDVPLDTGPAPDRGERFAAAGERPEGAGTGDRPRKAGGGDTEAPRRTNAAARAAIARGTIQKLTGRTPGGARSCGPASRSTRGP